MRRMKDIGKRRGRVWKRTRGNRAGRKEAKGAAGPRGSGRGREGERGEQEGNRIIV